jgi:hypothetical protein
LVGIDADIQFSAFAPPGVETWQNYDSLHSKKLMRIRNDFSESAFRFEIGSDHFRLWLISPKEIVPVKSQSFLTPIYVGTIPSNLSWSTDNQDLIFLGTGIERAVNVSTADWYKYDTLTNTLSQYQTWPLQPALSTTEKQEFMPLSLKRPSFIYGSPNGQYLTYAIDETYKLTLANRQPVEKIVLQPGVTIPDPISGPDAFNVLWSNDSTAYTVMYASAFSDDFGTIFVSGYTSDISNGVNLYIGESGFNDRYFRHLRIHDIASDGKLVLLTGEEVIPNSDAQDFRSKLILWNPATPDSGEILDSIASNSVRGAGFANNENMLLFINDQGLLQYDRLSGETIVLSSDFSSNWIQDAIFSPLGDKVAITSSVVDGTIQIFVVAVPTDALTLTP